MLGIQYLCMLSTDCGRIVLEIQCFAEAGHEAYTVRVSKHRDLFHNNLVSSHYAYVPRQLLLPGVSEGIEIVNQPHQHKAALRKRAQQALKQTDTWTRNYTDIVALKADRRSAGGLEPVEASAGKLRMTAGQCKASRLKQYTPALNTTLSSLSMRCHGACRVNAYGREGGHCTARDSICLDSLR